MYTDNTEDYQFVIKNIYYDLIKMMEEDGKFTLLKADDMLPTMAALMTRTNWEKALNINDIAKAVKDYLWNDPRLGCYTKRALIRRFRANWLQTLTDEEKQKFVTQFRLFTGFDEDGYANINEKFLENYKGIFEREKDYKPIKFKVIHIPTLPKGTPLKMEDDGDFKKYVSEDIDGYWTVPTFISENEWYDILQGVSDGIKLMLSCFLQMPGHRASISQIEREFGINQYSVNACNSALGRRAYNFLGNFEVRDPEGIFRLWSIPMNRGKMEDDGTFSWELRPELASAATRYLEEIGFQYKKRLE